MRPRFNFILREAFSVALFILFASTNEVHSVKPVTNEQFNDTVNVVSDISDTVLNKPNLDNLPKSQQSTMTALEEKVIKLNKCCKKNETAVGNRCSTKLLDNTFEELAQTFLSNYEFGRRYDIEWIYPKISFKLKCQNARKTPVGAIDFKLYGNVLKDTELGTFNNDMFCLDIVNSKDNIIGAVVCYDTSEEPPAVETHHIFQQYGGMIISIPFLLATFLVYAVLPERNLHQWALMFYVLTLGLSYILLVTINLANNFNPPFCSIIGYFTLFFFMVSFFWINVICFDIWYTFSGGRGFVGGKRASARRKFLMYSAYAWGVPLFIVILAIILQNVLEPTSMFNPGIGLTKCFLTDGWPNLWYFYGEASILVIANIIFFALTACKIRQVKKETMMLKQNDSKRHAYEKDKQKFNLYLKLLFAMGINWTMEVISFLVNWQTSEKYTEIWYVTDFFNAVYGVFIFFIFVFKKKIWLLLQKRYYTFIGKPHLAHSLTSTTQRTQTSHYSSGNYSTADTNITDRTSVPNRNTIVDRHNGAAPEEMALQRMQ